MRSETYFGKLLFASAFGLALLAVASSSDAQEQAGVSAAVRGDVQLARAEVVGRRIESGQPILLDDGITSGTQSGMQILMLDQTVFTIGPESELTIDKFIFDPSGGSGSLSAELVKGSMKFITGSIASGDPNDIQIKLPIGTLGIRGTTGVAAVLSQQQAQQQFPDQTNQLGGAPGQPVIFAALVGPGPFSAAGSGSGSFNFTTPNGDVDLNRPGAAVFVSPGVPPLTFFAPPGAIQDLTSGLAGTNQSDDGGGGNGSGGNNGGGNNGGGNGQSNGSSDSAINQSGVNSDQASQVLAQSLNVQTQQSQNSGFGTDVGQVGVTFATIGEVISTFTSSAARASGTVSGGIAGSFSSFISFADRTFDVQFSGLNGGGLTNASFGIDGGSTPLGGNGDTASFFISNNGGISPQGSCASTCSASVGFTSGNQATVSISNQGATGTGVANFTPDGLENQSITN